MELGTGKFVDVSTGAAALNAARISLSSAGGDMDFEIAAAAGLGVRPCSKLSQNCEF